jgi:tripartite-type tricarboxylate transporter receptor subunit TctC
MKRRTLITALGAATLTAHPSLRAQGAYPQKPVTLVVPSAPGGTTDFTARLIGEGLSRALGQPVVIDNKAGGAGNIGNQFVAKAKPDGHTLLVAYSGYQVGNPHLFANAGWDPLKDFTPVAMLTRAPQVIVVNANLKANTLAELVAFAKANPGKLNYASSGNGSIQHIAGELFKQLTGTFITHIPYRGAGPAVQDLIGGQVELFMTTPASVVQHVKSGKLKALAVSSNTRWLHCPRCPPPWRPASRASRWTPGLRSTDLPACPPTWCSGSAAKSTRSWRRQKSSGGQKRRAPRLNRWAPHSWATTPARSWTTGARSSRRRRFRPNDLSPDRSPDAFDLHAVHQSCQRPFKANDESVTQEMTDQTGALRPAP